MIEQKAKVIALKGDQIQIAVPIQSACGHCANRGHCSTASWAQLFSGSERRYWLNNSINARIGDQILIGVDESSLSRASFLIYILPLLALIAGAMIAAQFSDQEWISILFALFSFAISLILIRFGSQRFGFQVKIIRVLNSELIT